MGDEDHQGSFTVILREEEEGGYSVQLVELPGAISQGDTKREAVKNTREAIQWDLEAFPDEGQRLIGDRPAALNPLM